MILTRDGKEIIVIYRQDGSEVEEVKDATGRIVYSASREITGTLPLYFSSRGKPLTDYLISGNTVQNGTPTPDNPVDVVGCGEKTGNLVDPSTIILNSNISSLGRVESEANYDVGCFQIIQGNTYTIDSYVYAFYYAIPGIGSRAYNNLRVVETPGIPSSFTAPITGYCCFRVAHGDSFMANTGATLLPYEPYGYKLPLTIGDTEYPIYLGQVDTTRRIKKLVLTGEENWAVGSVNYYSSLPSGGRPYSNALCTHAKNASSVDNSGAYLYLQKSAFVFETLTDLKSYLASQYAAGTPVTVWYVLAESETAVVNEPLMKIGDYADTISFTQAGETIPTVSGANVLDMTSTVKPSAVSITGNIKPTGYGQLFDVNDVDIQDSTGEPVYIQG